MNFNIPLRLLQPGRQSTASPLRWSDGITIQSSKRSDEIVIGFSPLSLAQEGFEERTGKNLFGNSGSSISIPVSDPRRTELFLKRLVAATRLEAFAGRTYFDLAEQTRLRENHRQLDQAWRQQQVAHATTQDETWNPRRVIPNRQTPIFFHPITQLALPTAPPWYYGFVRPTAIQIRYLALNSDVRFRIHIGGQATGRATLDFLLPRAMVSTDYVIPIAYKIPFANALTNAVNKEDDSLFLSLMDLWFESIGLREVIWKGLEPDPNPTWNPDDINCALTMVCDTDVWSACKDTKAFSHMQFSVVGAGEVGLTSVQIILNGQTILDTNEEIAVRGSELELPRTIAFNQPFTLDKWILRHRMRQVGYTKIPSIDTIISFAARHLGESWFENRPGIWPYHAKQPVYWAATGNDWCSEFTSWAIDSVAGLTNKEGDRLFDQSSDSVLSRCKDVQLWFKQFIPSRWISPVSSVTSRNYITHATTFEQLGDLLQSGFYTSLNQFGHSTLFAGWASDDFDRGPVNPVTFNASGLNYFYGLGGNQGNIVCINTYSISDNIQDNPNVRWFQNTIEDGFGNTRARVE